MLTLASFVLFMAMLGLCFTNIALTSKNITHIDALKGNFRFSDPHRLFPNPFDLGAFSNFASLFEGQQWTFWWPSEIVARADGLRFPLVPAVPTDDFKCLPANIQ